MGCVHEAYGTGKCVLVFDTEMEGSENGYCVCSSDPDPLDSCEHYESDNECPNCGADLNVVECNCEEDD